MQTHRGSIRAFARFWIVRILGIEVFELGVRVDDGGGTRLRAPRFAQTEDLTRVSLRVVFGDLDVVDILADAKHHAEVTGAGPRSRVRAGLSHRLAALGEREGARGPQAAGAARGGGGRRGRAELGPESGKAQAAHHLLVRGDARGALAFVRRQTLCSCAWEEGGERGSARVAKRAERATRLGRTGKKTGLGREGEREKEEKTSRFARAEVRMRTSSGSSATDIVVLAPQVRGGSRAGSTRAGARSVLREGKRTQGTNRIPKNPD